MPSMLGDLETARCVVSHLVTRNYFRLLGVRPILGRDFQAGDDAAILIPYTLWQSQFGSDPLTGRPVTIIGVLPENWRGGFRRIYVPLGDEAIARTPDFEIVGRLRPGVSIEAAKAQVTTVSRRLEEQFPITNRGWMASVVPEAPVVSERLQDERNRLLALLFAAVGFVLLIACVNIAALLLARAAVRRKELALRQALGATRGRIVRQWLIESLVLASIAAVAGLLLAYDGGPLIARLWNIELPGQAENGLAAFVAIATLLCSLLFGVIPAWQATASDALALHTGRNVNPGAMRLRSALIWARSAWRCPCWSARAWQSAVSRHARASIPVSTRIICSPCVCSSSIQNLPTTAAKPPTSVRSSTAPRLSPESATRRGWITVR
jgi:predicted lysophospholipase L1 biosynthesis ABC-type transport system permease subunit